MFQTNQVKIKSYNDFVEQLTKIKETGATAVTLSFYKYCAQHETTKVKRFKDLIFEELKEYGLKPVKMTENLNLIFRYKKEAEAIIYIKPYKVDLLIYRL